jgi:hypothetical protein
MEVRQMVEQMDPTDRAELLQVLAEKQDFAQGQA